MGAPSLLIHVAAPPPRLAGRLKVLMAQRGWRLLAADATLPLDGFALHVTALGRGSGLVRPEPADAAPDDLARVLSHVLRARTVAYVESWPIVAYEACEDGRVVDKLALRGGDVIEDVDSPHRDRAVAGEPLAGLLEAAGVEGLVATPATARSVTLRFAPSARREAEALEVEAVITCPRCGAPLVKRVGRHGEFWACAHYPRCRGTRSVADVERRRRAAR